MLGYTFLNHTSISIDKTQEKYYCSNLNILGPSPPCHLMFQQSSLTIRFPIVDLQWVLVDQ